MGSTRMSAAIVFLLVIAFHWLILVDCGTYIVKTEGHDGKKPALYLIQTENDLNLKNFKNKDSSNKKIIKESKVDSRADKHPEDQEESIPDIPPKDEVEITDQPSEVDQVETTDQPSEVDQVETTDNPVQKDPVDELENHSMLFDPVFHRMRNKSIHDGKKRLRF